MSQKIIKYQDNLLNVEDWQYVKNSIVKLYIQPQKNNMVFDQQMIIEQHELLQEIKEKIQRQRFKQNFGNLQILPIDSNISNINSAYNYGDDQSLIRNRFTQQFQSSLVNSALKETFETIRNYVINNKQKEYEAVNKNLDKKSREVEQLQLTIILKQNEIVKLKEQLNPFLQNFNNFQEEKKKIKRKNDLITQKQKRIHKAEMALIFKQKMNQQSKKRMERLKQFGDSIYNKMKQIENSLNKIWEQILNKMQNNHNNLCCETPDPKGCWKKEVMKKCREKILQERDLLKQEQKQLQKEYEVLQTISNQCKKLVSQSQESMISNLSINQNASVVIPTNKDQQGKKLNSLSLITMENNRSTSN